MRILVTALLSAIVLLNMSCGKDKDDNRQRRFISLKLDNKIYLAESPKGIITVPNFTDEDPTNDVPKMEITGQSYTGDAISLKLIAPALPFKTGTYPCNIQGNNISIVLNAAYPAALSSAGSSNCYITISKIDNISVEGSFSGTLTDIAGTGGPRTVKDGAFRAIITQVSN